MKFKLSKKFDQEINYDIEEVPSRFIEALASVLTEEEYHELAHQLNGTKSEYDLIDGELENGSLPMVGKKFRVVKDSLYRGIFWQTVNKLDWLKNE